MTQALGWMTLSTEQRVECSLPGIVGGESGEMKVEGHDVLGMQDEQQLLTAQYMPTASSIVLYT